MIRKKEAGVTLIELMVVIGMLAILSGIVTPNIMAWRREAQLRNATTQLWGDLQKARSVAIKENQIVRIGFEADRYVIYKEDGPVVLSQRNLPAGASIDLGNTTFTDDDPTPDGKVDTSFNGQGVPKTGVVGDRGEIVITGSTGSKKITINIIGRIEMKDF